MYSRVYFLKWIVFSRSGQLNGLTSSQIQTIDVLNSTTACYPTKDPLETATQQDVLVVENFTLRVDGMLLNAERTLVLNEPFAFSFRVIGSQRLQQRESSFNGVAVFVVEQNDITSGVYSTLSN